MCKGKAQNFCPLLCSMYGDTTNLSEPVPMLVFLEHINKISLALQKKMCTIDNVQNCITSSLYHIPCVVKLMCIYSTRQRCGLSYEVIETFPGVWLSLKYNICFEKSIFMWSCHMGESSTTCSNYQAAIKKDSGQCSIGRDVPYTRNVFPCVLK